MGGQRRRPHGRPARASAWSDVQLISLKGDVSLISHMGDVFEKSLNGDILAAWTTHSSFLSSWPAT